MSTAQSQRGGPEGASDRVSRRGDAAAPGYALRGRSIIAGEPAPDPAGVEPGSVFRAIDPGTGNELPTPFLAASPEDVDRAGWRAWEAFYAMRERSAAERADLLDRIADQIARLGDLLIATATDETGLGPARLVSERDRTVNTLRMFAAVVRDGEWLEAAIDTAQPSRRPIPKPDIRRMLRPLGPVAVFGAGNFSLAYSTGGGDTASALAAGCPVVVKGHPGHPGTGELVAQAITRAVESLAFHPGTFSFLHAGPLGSPREFAIGQQLVTHAGIRAVGFTGSLAGGTALAKLASERPDPIPVFAEMGSVNPVFILPGATEAGGTAAETIADRLVASMTNSNGQMCTCPGLVFGVRSQGLESLVRAMSDSLDRSAPQPMLNTRVLQNYARRTDEVMRAPGVELRGGSPNAGHVPGANAPAADGFRCSPALFRTTYAVFKRTASLHEEVFGPAVVVVVSESDEELVEAAAAIHGSLTGTVWMNESLKSDGELARKIASVLEQRVGRLIYNGVPTGVEVCPSMVHGGPYPATNQAHSTAVGPYAIQRWCRPVCWQNAPESMLPEELRSDNPSGLRRRVNGQWSDGAV